MILPSRAPGLIEYYVWETPLDGGDKRAMKGS